MAVESADMAKKLLEAINQIGAELEHLNIVVVGKSGAGKSTLINSIFRGKFAETGLGRPVTQKIQKIEKKDFPLTIYDTPGFELAGDQQDQVKDAIFQLIDEGEKTGNNIHCIWYCINVGSNRTFDSTELAWLRSFTKSNQKYKVPIIIILTQAIPKSKGLKMKRLVEREHLDIIQAVPVLAKEVNFDGEYTAESYGLDNLIEIMGEFLPDELDDTLQNVQIASLEAKKKKAHKIISRTVKTAFGEGFAPVPVSDATLLIPTQISMIARITNIFGLDVSRSYLVAFIGSTIGTGGATVLGRSVVANIMKLVPGLGSIAGGVISGATAAVITSALGESYIILMEALYKADQNEEELSDKEVKQLISESFKKTLEKENQKYIRDNGKLKSFFSKFKGKKKNKENKGKKKKNSGFFKFGK